MNWQIILVLNVFIYVVAWVLIRLIVKKLPWRAQALSLQFLICAFSVSLYGLVTGNFHFSIESSWVMFIGFCVAFGAYCQWRAIDLSLSKTSLLFSPITSVFTILLATIFLGEMSKWNLMLAGGITILFAAVFFFYWSTRSKAKKGNDQKRGNFKQQLFFISVMVVIFGTSVFLRKKFSNIPLLSWMTYWYIGTFLGSLPLLYLERQNPFKFPGKMIFLVPLSSLAILASLVTQFWAIDLTLVSRVESFRLIGTTFLPVLAGWFIFKERKGLLKREILAFSLGIAGAMLIIIS